ncbi:putative leucine-rich repeat-containing protein DDB_G0290503 isoform X5 [Branchiostoma lanceolatum]|uniref:putative leucine-rich repeat-containing protein DDB_G0290503 isoform X5 n=1 Tax=Branchiostoma lanceolatum TaxID=7740 RepID=UPI003454B750
MGFDKSYLHVDVIFPFRFHTCGSDGAIRNRRQSLMRRLAAVDTRHSVSFDSYCESFTTTSEGSSFENDDLLSMEVIQRLRAIEASGSGNDDYDDDVFETTSVNEPPSPKGIPVLEVSEAEDDHKYLDVSERQADPAKLADYKTVFINNWMGAKQPYENDMDYMLRIRSAASSPGPGCLSRGSSFDSSGTVSDLLEHRVGSAELTLMELGFGGSGFDIPIRFLPSLKHRLKSQANTFWLAGQDAKSPTTLWSSRHSSLELSSDDGHSDAQSLRSIETESESLIFGRQQQSEEKIAKHDQVGADKVVTEVQEVQRPGKTVKIVEDCKKHGDTTTYSDVSAAAKRKRLVKAATITATTEAMNSPWMTQNVRNGSAHAPPLLGRTVLDLLRLKRKRMHFVKQKSLPTNLETLPEVEEKPRPCQSSSSDSRQNSSPMQSAEDPNIDFEDAIKDSGTEKPSSALEALSSTSSNCKEMEQGDTGDNSAPTKESHEIIVQQTSEVTEHILTSGHASLVSAKPAIQRGIELPVKAPCSEGITVGGLDHNCSDKANGLADSEQHGISKEDLGYPEFARRDDCAHCKVSEILDSGHDLPPQTMHGSDDGKIHSLSSSVDDKDVPKAMVLQGNKPSDEEWSKLASSAGPKLFVRKVAYKESLMLERPLILQLPIKTTRQCFSNREAVASSMLLQDDQAIGRVTDFCGLEKLRSCIGGSRPNCNPCSNVWQTESGVHRRRIRPNAANVGYIPDNVCQGKQTAQPLVCCEMDACRSASTILETSPQTEYSQRRVSNPSQKHFFDEIKGQMTSIDTPFLDRSSKAGAMGSSEVGRRRDSGKLQSTPKTYSALPDVSASMPDVSAISVSSDRNRSPGIGGRYRSYDDINSTIMPRAERTNQSPSSLRDAEQGLRDAQAQKQTALSEMREIQESLKSKRSEVNQAEHHVQDMQSKSDELRAEIMVLEYKRDSVEKELQGVHKDMEAMTRPSSRQRDREELGMSKEQVLEVVRERDELRARLRSGEGQISGLERRELERQLNATKEDLFSEQRKSRAKVEELQDELEECKRQLEESQLDKGDAVHQMEQLHLKVKELERARKRDIENKSDALDNASKRARADLTDFKAQLAERDRMIASLEAELHEKDKLNRKLQETVYKMQEELSQESELKDSLIEENEKNVVKLKKDKETSLAALRHMLLEDKQRELDRLRDQSDRERRDILARQEERMAEQLAEMEQRILAKDDEVTMVRERLRQQEEATRTLGDRMRLEAKEQIRSAISKEKASWEAEKERAVQREKDRCQDDSNKQLSKVQEELEKEKQLHNQADKNCTGLKQELDQARQQIRAAHRDKLAAINDVRDSMKVEKEEEIKQLREQLTQGLLSQINSWKEKVSDVEKLREKMRKLEDELRTVRSEKNSVAVREKETSMLLDRHEKSVVSEINDECQRSAQLLGTAPRSVKVPSGDQQEDDEFDQSLDISENRGQSPHKSRSAVSEALANLKATNEDLRKLVTGLHEDMASQKKATQQVNKEKEREVKQLRELYHSEKEKEVETMRERLIQDHLDEIGKLQHAVKKDKDEVSTLQHNLISKDEELREIQRNMTAWKDATIKKLAKKFEQEMNLELEKRQHEKDRQAHSSQLKRIEELEEEVQRLSVVRKTFQSTPTTPSRVSGPSSSSQSSMAGGDASTIKLLRHLQDRVKQLRVENKELRRLSGEGSDAINGNGTPDVSVSFQEEAVLRESPYVQNLERKLKHMDRQLNVAEERAQKNTALLGQKMVELTKLQNQLTHQTKEYLHLERSYSDMQKRYHRGGLR